jgi:flagellar basal-body rod protein FlgB
MNLDSISLFRFASERMQWLTARQKAISENIANADTPGYHAKDVTAFQAYVDSVHQAQAGGTATDSFGPTAPVETVDSPDTWASTICGNTVVLEQQTVKAGQTAAQYQLAANLYRKADELLTLAATGQ